MTREEIIEEARRLVGDDGEVRDYACDCGWTETHRPERFIVRWKGVRGPDVCYDIEELRKDRQ